MKDCVIGIIFNKDKSELLLTKRRDIPIWVLPGGGLEPQEEPEKAVIREIFEETELKTVVTRKIGEYYPVNHLTRTTHVFECQPLSGTPQPSDETKEVAFFPIKHLPTPFFPLHQEWLNNALENHALPLKSPITQVTYFAILKYFLKHPLLVIRALLARLGLPINT